MLIYKKGNPKAKEAIYSKFSSCSEDVHRRSSKTGAFTACAIAIIDLDGIEGLEYVTNTMGGIVARTGRKEMFDTDWIKAHAEIELGKEKVTEFFREKPLANDNIKVFLDEAEAEPVAPKEKLKPDFETIMSVINNGGMELRNRNTLRLLSKKMAEQDLIKLAKEIENTGDENKQNALLCIFISTPYPLPIDNLLNLSRSSNKELAGAAATALGNIKDERIHDLAMELIRDKYLCVYGLGLLELNFDNDHGIILQLLKKEYERLKSEEAEFDFHSLVMAVRDIYEYNKSTESIDSLRFIYHNTDCSYCRSCIVKIMCDNEILQRNIAEECMYDCLTETREMAAAYLKKKTE